MVNRRISLLLQLCGVVTGHVQRDAHRDQMWSVSSGHPLVHLCGIQEGSVDPYATMRDSRWHRYNHSSAAELNVVNIFDYNCNPLTTCRQLDIKLVAEGKYPTAGIVDGVGNGKASRPLVDEINLRPSAVLGTINVDSHGKSYTAPVYVSDETLVGRRALPLYSSLWPRNGFSVMHELKV